MDTSGKMVTATLWGDEVSALLPIPLSVYLKAKNGYGTSPEVGNSTAAGEDQGDLCDLSGFLEYKHKQSVFNPGLVLQLVCTAEYWGWQGGLIFFFFLNHQF